MRSSVNASSVQSKFCISVRSMIASCGISLNIDGNLHALAYRECVLVLHESTVDVAWPWTVQRHKAANRRYTYLVCIPIVWI